MCEKINTRHKYLSKNNPDSDELKQINELYEILAAKGLEPPGRSSGLEAGDVTAAIEEHKEALAEIEELSEAIGIQIPANTPPELVSWLERDLGGYAPAYLQESVYESLQKRYRPQTGHDLVTALPTYDNTYRVILNEILKRFDKYEEDCADD